MGMYDFDNNSFPCILRYSYRCSIIVHNKKTIYIINYITFVGFENTKMDYIILIGSTAIFLYFLFTMKRVYIGNGQYVWEANIQIFIAPLVAVHRMLLIVAGILGLPRLREINKRLWLQMQILKIRDHFREGMEEYREWRKRYIF